jgi:hypothetical protein
VELNVVLSLFFTIFQMSNIPRLIRDREKACFRESFWNVSPRLTSAIRFKTIGNSESCDDIWHGDVEVPSELVDLVDLDVNNIGFSARNEMRYMHVQERT